MRNKNNKFLLLSAIIFIAIFLFTYLKSIVIDDDDLMRTRFSIIELRIICYYSKNGKLPMDLSELPVLKKRDNSINDTAGNKIQYEISGDYVILKGKAGLVDYAFPVEKNFLLREEFKESFLDFVNTVYENMK